MPLDHPPSPGIGHRVANGAEEALHARRLVDMIGEAQLDGVELHGVCEPAVAPAVHERTDRSTGGSRGEAETPRGDELGGAGQHDVDEALPVRTSSPSPRARRAIFGLRACSSALPSSSRSGSATSSHVRQEAQSPERAQMSGDADGRLALLDIGDQEARHAHTLGQRSLRQLAAEAGGAKVAPEPLQRVLDRGGRRSRDSRPSRHVDS